MRRTLEPEVMDAEEEARSYDAMDHSEPNRAFVARLVSLGARGRMIDIGCGPGEILLRVCDAIADGHVLGVDLSAPMIELARARRDLSEHRGRIELAIADAKDMAAHADGSFDAVLSNTLLHHIPEPIAFLGECRRLLRRGGALLIRDLFRPATEERVTELVEMHAADCDAEQRELFRASLCAALTPGELRVLADSAGLGSAQLIIDSDRHMSLQAAATAP